MLLSSPESMPCQGLSSAALHGLSVKADPGEAQVQVGSEVARRGLGLGFAKVIAYDPYASASKAAALGVPLVTFDEALQQGDFFSLHMPLTEGTKV